MTITIAKRDHRSPQAPRFGLRTRPSDIRSSCRLIPLGVSLGTRVLLLLNDRPCGAASGNGVVALRYPAEGT